MTSDDRSTFKPTIGAPPPELPKAYTLHQNYPDPFNPATTIKYEIPTQSCVAIKISNLLGQEVKTRVSGIENAGAHQTLWDGKNNLGISVASGVYLYRIVAKSVSAPAASFTQVKKMLLLRSLLLLAHQMEIPRNAREVAKESLKV